MEVHWQKCLELDNNNAHHLAVKRLKFRPSKEATSDIQLASCGADGFVKIYRIQDKS